MIVLTDAEIEALRHLGGGLSPRAIEAAVIEKLVTVSVEPALYVPPKRDGEFHHEHASVAGYRSPTAGWEPLYTEEALAAAKLQAREEYRQELLGESVEPVAHVVSGIRKSGLEPGQSSPASIMRMSVEMSAP